MSPLSASPPEILNLVYECTLETFRFSLEASPLMQPVIHPFAGKQAFRSFLNPILRTFFFLRKEVIQPHLPIRLPCYDFTPVTCPAFGSSFLSVRSLTSGVADSHGVTGGVYKTRERIHRGMLIRDY